MSRDVASILGCPKPAVIHSEFLPPIDSPHGKMNTTTSTNKTKTNTTIYLNTDRKTLGKIIKQHAFSGGKDTLENHRKYGGDINSDVCYKYLVHLMPDDEKLRDIAA